MSTPHKATPAQWEHLENGAQADRPYNSARCLLELRDRITALEAQRESNWARIVKLEAMQQQQQEEVDHVVDATEMVSTPEAAPVATDAELRQVSDAHSLWSDIRRACYDLGREHGIAVAQPTPPAVPVPAGGLVERATEAILEAMVISDAAAAHAAINAVAEWFDTIGYGATASILRQEVQRG